MKSTHIALLISLFGLSACTVDVPDPDQGDFRCYGDSDCADGYICDAAGASNGEGFCRPHDDPNTHNPDGCDTATCSFPYHCDGDDCEPDSSACSSWNDVGDCPGTVSKCHDGICVDPNYSCGADDPLACDDDIECYLNGLCTNYNGSISETKCDPAQDGIHQWCIETHGSNSFCMAQPKCDDTNPDGCGFPLVDDVSGNCKFDETNCGPQEWEGYCPTGSNCEQGVCTLDGFACDEGDTNINELCADGTNYCAPHGVCVGYVIECTSINP